MQDGRKIEARRSPRIQLEFDVIAFSQKDGLVPGRTLDISETGISAVLPVELPIGQAVRLEIRFPLEPVSVRAIVRNRNIFRYGFEFEQTGTGRELLKRIPSKSSQT